jgi:hypothetical protein
LAAGGNRVAALYSLANSLEGTPYSQALRNDCSGMVSQLASVAVGLPPPSAGQRFNTTNEQQWLLSHGFQMGIGPPGSLRIGWNPAPGNAGHTAATLPDGRNAESGGSHGNFTVGPKAAGFDSPQFTMHAYLPMGTSSPLAPMMNKALFSGEGPQYYGQAFAHNSPFAMPSSTNWQTQLSPEDERTFTDWVRQNKVPFNPADKTPDYDMRGFWQAMQSGQAEKWTPGSHFPDTFKTPYDTTFSAESKYAKPGTPFKWQGDNLIDTRSGQLIFGSGDMTPGATPGINGYNNLSNITGQTLPGTQQNPMYVDYGPNSQFGKSSGGEQLGQDIFSGLLEVFGFDGSVFKNPTSFGGFKMFKGLMGALTGGGKGQQGMPASYYAGGDGASLAAPGGGDLLNGGLDLLQGFIPQPFGPLKSGSPGAAPAGFLPGAPGSAGSSALNWAPKTVPAATVDNSITVNTTGTAQEAFDAAHQANVPRMRQGTRSLPG